MRKVPAQDRKLAFHAPAVPDKYRDNVDPYVGEVTLYTSPSNSVGYQEDETGIALTGVIDGREVIGRLRRGLYGIDISFLCANTNDELFVGDLIVRRDESKPLFLLVCDIDREKGRSFASESVPDSAPALREWGVVQNLGQEITSSLLNITPLRMRQLLGQ